MIPTITIFIILYGAASAYEWLEWHLWWDHSTIVSQMKETGTIKDWWKAWSEFKRW